MSSPDRIDNGSPRIRFPHAHKKAYDEVHLGGGEMAQQASRTFRWIFGDVLKARKPWDRSRKTWKGFPDLTSKCWGIYANLHSEPLLLVRAESRLHIEDETASRAFCNNLLWEAMLGLELLRKSKWSYMRDLQKVEDFL